MSKIKFLSLAYKITPAIKACLQEIPRRGGMYNWIFLFKGDIKPYPFMEKKDFEEYDIVQVNMSTVDRIILSDVADILKNSSTKLVLNNDYVVERWNNGQQHPVEYLNDQKYGDMIFGTTPTQAGAMRDGAFAMPHPHWIEMLKKIGRPKVENKIGTLYHWWGAHTYIPSLVIHKLKQRVDKKIYSRLYAYEQKYDDNQRWAKVMWDDFIPPMAYPDFIKHLMTNKMVYEPVWYHTYGRTSVDTAAFGVPTVGSNRVGSMVRCFPEMSCNPVDVRATVDIMEKILTDDEWVKDQLDFASKACEYYNYKNSKERFLTALDFVDDGKTKDVKGFYDWNEEGRTFELR